MIFKHNLMSNISTKKGKHMSVAKPCDINPLTLSLRDDNSTIFSIKNLNTMNMKQENILLKLAYMCSFEELSRWVEINSKNKKFIANPFGASDTDRMDCLFYVQEPIARAIKGQNKRKNGRDIKLIKAAKTADYAAIADVLSSTAWTYWQDHGFFSGKNFNNELAAVSMIKNEENNQQKKEFQKAQIESIGAAVCFQKAQKKGTFQSSLDFEETEIILKNIDFELER